MAPTLTSKFRPWLMWAPGALFYFYQFILRSSPNALADDIRIAFSVDAKDFGIMAAAYYYTYAALQMLVGSALDFWGPKKVLRIAIALCSVGSLLFAIAPNYPVLFAARMLIGFGAASGFVGTIRLGTLWFPPQKWGLMVGATSAVGKVGGVSAALILSFTLQFMSWRTTLGYVSFLGIILSCVLWIYLREPENSANQRHAPLGVFLKDVKSMIASLVRKKSLWALGLYGCCMYTPLSSLADAWGISFLMALHPGLTKAQGAMLTALLFIGGAVGGPIIAAWSDRWGKRKPVMLLSSLTTAGCAFALIVLPPGHVYLTGLWLFLIGALMTGQTLVFAAACDHVPAERAGIATGFINTFVMLSGVVFQPLIGCIMAYLWDGSLLQGVPVYAIETYRSALIVIPVAVAISPVFLLFFKEEAKSQVVMV